MTVAQRFVPGQPPARQGDKPDLDSPARIEEMVDLFYQRVLEDPLLAPVFLEVAGIDLQQHLPTICQYWYKMLLGEQDYQRHMMAKHRALDDREPLTGEHHERWLGHFMANLEGRFAGPMTDRARLIAQRVMHNLYMQLSARRGHGSGEG